MPATIKIVDDTLSKIDCLDVSSPNKPPHTFDRPILYINANKTLDPPTAVTKEAGPKDKAHRSIMLPICAVTPWFIMTNVSPGFRSRIMSFTSVITAGLKAKETRTNPKAIFLKPCVYTTDISSTAILPATPAAPNSIAENIRE